MWNNDGSLSELRCGAIVCEHWALLRFTNIVDQTLSIELCPGKNHHIALRSVLLVRTGRNSLRCRDTTPTCNPSNFIAILIIVFGWRLHDFAGRALDHVVSRGLGLILLLGSFVELGRFRLYHLVEAEVTALLLCWPTELVLERFVTEIMSYSIRIFYLRIFFIRWIVGMFVPTGILEWSICLILLATHFFPPIDEFWSCVGKIRLTDNIRLILVITSSPVI